MGLSAAQRKRSQSESDPQFMQSLARGLQVLEAFTGLPPSVTIPQLAKETGLARAVVTRCLHTLVALGYVEEHERHYSICPHVLRLAGAYLSARSLPILAQPLLEDLRDSLGESCSLGVLDGDEIVYVARASTTRIMAVSLHVGSRLPAYCTSMGRILLAALPPDKLQAALDRVTPIQRTPHSITDRAELQQAIMAVANQGYAVVDQELELGLRSVAVPVRDRNGRVVAALNLGTNAMRLSVKDLKARVLPELRAVAENLQRLAG